MLGSMIPGEQSPTRVVSYVVSGVGFLGGGVILREGFTVLWDLIAVYPSAEWGQHLPPATAFNGLVVRAIARSKILSFPGDPP